MGQNFYIYWLNEFKMETCSDVADTIEEARNIISHWVPNMDSGDTFKLIAKEDM